MAATVRQLQPTKPRGTSLTPVAPGYGALLIREHVHKATPPASRRWAWVLDALEFLSTLALGLLLAACAGQLMAWGIRAVEILVARW